MVLASATPAVGKVDRHSWRRGWLPARRGRKHGRAGLLFVLPFILLFLGVFIVPLGYAFYLSLFSQHLFGGAVFSGLHNYVAAFEDPAFRAGIGVVLEFFVVQVPIMLVLAVVFALVIDSGRLRWPRLFRLAFFVPYAVPSVVAAILWGSLYSPSGGPLTDLAHTIGFAGPVFFSNGGILPSVANIVTWEFTGYNMIIFYAALRAVPPVLYEAAEVDGASRVRVALHIKLPHLKPALLLTLVFSIIGSFQLFNEPSVLGAAAGPALIPSSWTPNLYAYTLAFTNQQLNYAAAISFLLGFLIFFGTLLVLGVVALRRRRSWA